MGRIIIAAVAASVCTLAFAASASASGEFEPNDSFNTAAGPIFSGLDYNATYETTNDEDYYFFYLPQQTQLRYSLKNSSTASNHPNICIQLYRQDQEEINVIYDGFLEVQAGQTGSTAISLSPGKYYLVTSCTGTIGKPYTLHLDPPGVTSTYEPFAQACANAHPAVEQASANLATLQAKLARAKSRHRHKAVKRLRPQVKAAKGDYRFATQTEAQACSVPQ